MKKKAKKQLKPTPEYDSQRETRVLLKQIRSEVKVVAEGHDILDRKLDNVNTKLEEHDRRFDRLEMAVMENGRDIKKLDIRLGTLETDIEGLKTDIGGLKTDLGGLKTGQDGNKEILFIRQLSREGCLFL